MIDFEVRSRDGFARVGRFSTPHGPIDTPALLPVVHPDRDRQVVSAGEISDRFGLRAVITSAYIAWRSPHLRDRTESAGVHRLIDFSGPVFTDSGAFQQHAYGHVEVAPQDILSFQERIGSDIATCLDIFVEPEATIVAARRGVETTHERAKEARAARSGLLAVTVQGGRFPELRRQSATDASTTGDIVAVGGVVPLLERYQFGELARVLLAVRPALAPDRAVHLFGTGHPLTFAFAALFGVDLFDSAAYHKFARRESLLFPEGTVPLDVVREPFCACFLCERLPLPRIRELSREERVVAIARHNLLMSAAEVRRVRQAIREGTIWELAERRAASHPALIAGLRAATRGAPAFFSVEPESRPSFRASSDLSLHRPAVERFRARVQGWRRGKGPFFRCRRVRLVPSFLDSIPAERSGAPIFWESDTEIGPVPLELTELYPVGCWLGADEFETPSDPESAEPNGARSPNDGQVAQWTRRQVSGLLEWLFGAREGQRLTEELRGVRSRSTGRLREFSWAGRPAFRLGNDGLPRPTWVGAQLMHRSLPPPTARVLVDPDAAEFVAEGKSLFSKFARPGDLGLVPGSSALLVDPEDRLLAVGRLELAPHELGRLRRGVAVVVTAHERAPVPAAEQAGPRTLPREEF